MLPATFLPAFKQAGFQVTGERELVDRLNEARDWQQALLTLLRHGLRVGVCFTRTRARSSVKTLARRFHLRPDLAGELGTL